MASIAFGGHGIVVHRGVEKVIKGVEGVGDTPNGVGAKDDGEAAVAVGTPHHRHLGVGGSGSQVGDGVAPLVGSVHVDVVEHRMAGSRGARAADGDIFACAGITGETGRIECGGGGQRDGVDRDKGGSVGDVDHHPHDKQWVGSLVGCGSGIEGNGEVADEAVVEALVDRRQYGVLVACVGVIVIMVPVHALAAVDNV